MRFADLKPYDGGEVIVFNCPCNDGSRVRLPKDRWTIENWPLLDLVNIRPSVDLRPNHRCHFTVTNGEVSVQP